MARFNKENLVEFLEEEIPMLSNDDIVYDYLYQRLSKDRNGETLNNLVNFILDTVEVTSRSSRDDPWKIAIETACAFGAALLKEDPAIRDSDLSSRQWDDVESLAETAARITDLIRRAGDSDDRDDRGGRGRGSRFDSRRESSSFGSRRSSRDTGRHFDDRDDRSSRGSSRRGYNSRREEPEPRRSVSDRRRRWSNDDRESRNAPPDVSRPRAAPAGMAERMYRNSEKAIEKRFGGGNVEEREAPARRPEQDRPRQPAYEQVEPENIQKASSWTQSKDPSRYTKDGKLMPDPTRPITQQEIADNRYDLKDSNVFMNIPLHPSYGKRSIGWEVDCVKPVWYLEEGYRKVKFTELTEGEKVYVKQNLHLFDIVGDDTGVKRRTEGADEIRRTLAAPRYKVEAQRRARDEEREEYERIIADIKAENEGKPEGEQIPMVDPIQITTLNSNSVLRLDEVINGFGMEHIRALANVKISGIVSDMEGPLNSKVAYNVDAVSHDPIHLADNEEDAARLLGMFARTGLVFKKETTGFTIQALYEGVKTYEGMMPPAMLSAIHKHVIGLLNDILTYELGSDLFISKFDEVGTFYNDLVEFGGTELGTKFANALRFHAANFQMFKIGSGFAGVEERVDQRTIYIAKRVGLVVCPALAKDLNVAAGKDGDKSVIVVNRESMPNLWGAISAIDFDSSDLLGNYRYLCMGDNEYLGLHKDYLDPENKTFIIHKV